MHVCAYSVIRVWLAGSCFRPGVYFYMYIHVCRLWEIPPVSACKPATLAFLSGFIVKVCLYNYMDKLYGRIKRKRKPHKSDTEVRFHEML